MIKEIKVSGRVAGAAHEYHRAMCDVERGVVWVSKKHVDGYYPDAKGTVAFFSIIFTVFLSISIGVFYSNGWILSGITAFASFIAFVFMIESVMQVWRNPKALEAHQKKLMKYAIKISQSDHHALASAVENAAITVTMHVREWNRYQERLGLGLIERDANHEEYEHVLTRARDTVDLAMRRTEFILRDRSRGKRIRSLQLPDLAEALEELQRADTAVKAHLDAAKEIGDDDPLLLARMQAEMDEALREIPGHQGARDHLGLAKS